MTFGYENLFIFETFSDFYCITPETQRVGQGEYSQDAESLLGPKLTTMP